MDRRNFLRSSATLLVQLSQLELLALGSEKEKQDVYITAFGPDSIYPINPSQDMAKHLSGLGYKTEILPVDYGEAPMRLREIIKNERPKIVVSLGLNELMRAYFMVEVNANNQLPWLQKIRENVGDRIELPALSLEYLQKRFESSGVTYSLSYNAGILQCNSLMFEGLMSTMNSRTKFYFFHVPRNIYTNSAKRDNLVKAIAALAP